MFGGVCGMRKEEKGSNRKAQLKNPLCRGCDLINGNGIGHSEITVLTTSIRMKIVAFNIQPRKCRWMLVGLLPFNGFLLSPIENNNKKKIFTESSDTSIRHFPNLSFLELYLNSGHS